LYFSSTCAHAQTPEKHPALWLSRTKNLHFATLRFQDFQRKKVIIARMNASPNEQGRAGWSPLYKIYASNWRWL